MHIARSDLKTIGVTLHNRQVSGIHDFSNDGQAGLVARIRQEPEAVFAQTLKTVWRCARLKSAAAQNSRATILDRARDGEKLFAAFDRAGPQISATAESPPTLTPQISTVEATPRDS